MMLPEEMEEYQRHIVPFTPEEEEEMGWPVALD